jgi:hypothetical protein
MGSAAMESFASIFRVILALALTFSLAGAQGAGPDDQEYQVYSAAIKDLLLVGNPGFINISDHTEYPDFMDRLLKIYPPFSKGPAMLDKGTLKSFVSQNSRHYPLQRLFNLSIEYAMVNEKYEPDATWIAGFSRVGFSPDGDQALLLLDHSAMWYVSEGTFVLLEKVDGRWRVNATELAYIGE